MGAGVERPPMAVARAPRAVGGGLPALAARAGGDPGPDAARRLSEALKAEARRLGFVAVGIASAEPFLDLAGLLLRRQAAGMATPWEDRDWRRRIDPSRLLPGARSLVAVAMAYDPPSRAGHRPLRGDPAGRARAEDAGEKRGEEPRGYVAAAGRTRSYQHVMGQRLEALGRWLEGRRPGCRWCVQVDTGPLVDRAVAQRAGIGWIGKNTCLIVPQHGSWVYLGELITDVELVPDAPLSDACGDCDLCLRACPTGAFRAPHQLDPRRCIAFLSQTNRPLGDQEREALGVNLYGCDACQTVCPFNRGAPSGHPALRPESVDDAAAPPLLELLTMSKTAFRRRYRALSGAWRGRKTWQRNAIVGLGNRRQRAAVPLLRRILRSDPRPDIRATAAWALGRIGGREACEALHQAYGVESAPEVRDAIQRALAAGRGAPVAEG